MGHMLSPNALIAVLFIAFVSPALAEPEQKQAEPKPAQKQEQTKRPEQSEKDKQENDSFDFSAIQDNILDIYKEQLGVTDEEWTIIRPRLGKVRDLNQAMKAMTAMMRWNTIARPLMRRQFEQSGYPDMMSTMISGFAERMQKARGLQMQDDKQQNAFQQALNELQSTLQREAPSTAEIKARMTAFRGAKEKVQQELLTAQSELKELLTVKQEAMLLMMGMLE